MTIKIHMRHARACKYCKSGIISFLEGLGIDPVDFFKNGISIAEFRKKLGSTNTLVERAITLAKNEEEK